MTEQPFEFEIDLEAGINRLKLREITGVEALIRAALAAREHPDYRPGRHFLVDMRDVTVSKIDTKVLQEIGRFVRQEWKESLGTRIAILVSREVDYGIARMFEPLSDNDLPFQYAIFRNADDAEAWLA